MEAYLALLEWLQTMGVRDIIANDIASIFERSTPKEQEKIQQNQTRTITPKPKPASLEESTSINTQKLMEEVKIKVSECKTLEELENYVHTFKSLDICHSAKSPVFYAGINDLNPDILVIGDIPEDEDDKTGKTFMGRSGKLMDKILYSIACDRDSNVRLTTAVNWRPAGGLDVTDQVLLVCKPILERHIELLKPKFILATGKTVYNLLFDEKKTLSQALRKKHTYITADNDEIPTFIIYHPTHMINTPQSKALAWNTMLKLKKELEK